MPPRPLLARLPERFISVSSWLALRSVRKRISAAGCVATLAGVAGSLKRP